MTTQRKHLRDYADARRDIELTEVAIEVMEKVTGSQRIVAALKKSQRKHLSRIDAAAEKLMGPYSPEHKA